MGGTPMTKFIVLDFSRAEKRKGGRRGRPGGFIVGPWRAKGARLRARRSTAGEGSV
jgi:hypothetical protein